MGAHDIELSMIRGLHWPSAPARCQIPEDLMEMYLVKGSAVRMSDRMAALKNAIRFLDVISKTMVLSRLSRCTTLIRRY